MKKNGLLLVLAAGACVAPAAFAQTSDTDNLPAMRWISVNDIQGGDYARDSYGDRVDLLVYSCGNGNDGTAGGYAGPTSSMGACDDVTFAGPGATGDVVVNGLAWGIWTPAVGAPSQYYMRVSFYDTYDLTLQTNGTAGAVTDPTAAAGAPIVWDLNLGTGWDAAPGAGLGYPGAVTFNGSVTVPDAFIGIDRTVGVKYQLFLDAAFTTPAPASAVYRRANNTSFLVGSSNVQGYYAGVAGNPAINTVSGGTLSAGNGRRGTYMQIQGTGYAPPRPTRELVNATGCLADGVTTRNSTVATGGVKWYTLCLNADAVDGVNQFFDIDTEGSATDVAIAVFDSTGNLITSDRDSGSGVNSQITYGMGRRAAVGDGNQYDGRNYLPGYQGLPAGEYDIAIGPADATFADGWGASSTAAGGAFRINFNTNTNGTPLAPSVLPPIAADLDAGGPIISPGAVITGGAFAPYQVNWYKFTTCKDATAAEPVILDMLSSTSFGNAQALYDSTGNLIASSSAVTGNAPDIVCDGATIALPAGTYYLAHSYDTNNIGATRWQFRSLSGDNGFTIGGTVNVFWTDCAGGCTWQADGCYADYNNDGNGIDGDDVIAFFADWDNGAPCADVDGANGVDGDDVIAFFGAWDAGGVGYPGC